MKEVGNKIRRLRENKQFTQEQVAGYLGITQSGYNRYETGNLRRYPSDYLEKIAVILDTTVDYLLGRTRYEDKMAHHHPDIIKWIFDVKSVEYLKMAYMKYINDIIK